MNFLSMLDPQKRREMELMQQMQAQQFMQQFTPEMLQQLSPPQFDPYAGYGVLQEATPQGIAGAEGAPDMSQALMGLLGGAAQIQGQQEEPQAPAPAGLGAPVGKGGNGLSSPFRGYEPLKRKRRGLLEQ